MSIFASLQVKPTSKCGIALFALLALTFAPRASDAQIGLTSQWGFQPSLQPTSIAYSPDGTLLAVGGPTGVSLYSTSTHLPYRGLATGVGDVLSIAFSPDGKTLAIGGDTAKSTGLLQLWSVSTGKLIVNLATAASTVNSVKFSPSSSTLIDGGVSSSTSSGVVEEWNTSTQDKTTSLKTSATVVGAVAFSPDGTQIAVVGSNAGNGAIEIWNAATSTVVQTLGPDQSTYLSSVVFSNSGRVIAVGGTSTSGALLQMWNLVDGCPDTLSNSSSGAITSVAFSPDGTALLGAGYTASSANGQSGWAGQLQVANLNTAAVTTIASGWNVASIAFSPDGSTLADLGTAEAWSAKQGAFEPTAGFFELRSASAGFPVSSVTYTAQTSLGATGSPAFSADGTMVVGGAIDLSSNAPGASEGFLNVWSTTKGTVIKALPSSASLGYYEAAFSPSNQLLAVTGTGSFAGVLQIWNISTGNLASSFTTGLIGDAVSFSPDGKSIAVAGYNSENGGVIQVWNLSTGKLIETLDSTSNDGIYGLAFSPDSSKIADGGSVASSTSVSNGVLEVWNVAKGQLAARLATKEAVVSGVSFSSDGTTLAAGGYSQATEGATPSGTLEIWNVVTQKLLKSAPLLTGTAGVSRVGYSPNGAMLYVAASGASNGIQVFDSTTYDRLGSISGTGAGLVALSTTSGGVASVSAGLSFSTMPAISVVSIESVRLSTPSILGGASCTGTVTLSQLAPAGGVVVALKGNSYAGTPATVNIPAGQASATFKVMAVPVNSTVSGSITASSGSSSSSATLTILGPNVSVVTLSASTVEGGSSLSGTVEISGPAALAAYTVSLSSSDPDVVVPATAMVKYKGTSTSFSINTKSVTTKHVVTITAKGGTTSKTITLTVNPSAK
jgi:WD40 repeat protein